VVSFESIKETFKNKTENCEHRVWFHGDEILELNSNHGLCGQCAAHVRKNESGEWIAYRTATGEKL